MVQSQVRPGSSLNQGFYQGTGPQMRFGGPFPPQMIRPGMETPTHHPGMGSSPGMMPQHPQQFTSHMTNQPTPISNAGPYMGQMMPKGMGHPRQMPMMQPPMYHSMGQGGTVTSSPQPIMGIERRKVTPPNSLRQQEVPAIPRPPGTALPFTDDYQRYPAAAISPGSQDGSNSVQANMVSISLPFFLSILPLLSFLIILAL